MTATDLRPQPDPTAGAPPDLAARAADAVDGALATVRAKTSEPVLARLTKLLWGTLLAFLGVAALVLLYALLLRLLVSYLPGGVWAAHLVLGLLFGAVGAGAVYDSRRRPAAEATPEVAIPSATHEPPEGTTTEVAGALADSWTLLVAYAKQEAVGPLKGLGSRVGTMLVGALLVGIGATELVVALLRALQTETGSAFTGLLTWVPYLITLGAVAVAGVVTLQLLKRDPGLHSSDG